MAITIAICITIIATLAFLYVVRTDILHHVQEKRRKEAEGDLEKQIKENHSIIGAVNAARRAKRMRDD